MLYSKRRTRTTKDSVLNHHNSVTFLLTLALSIVRVKNLVSLATHLHKFSGSSLLRWCLLARDVDNAMLGIDKDLDWILSVASRDVLWNKHLIVVTQQGALALRGSAVNLETSNAADKATGAIINAHRLLCKPWMGKALIDRESLLGVDNQHGINEIHSENC